MNFASRLSLSLQLFCQFRAICLMISLFHSYWSPHFSIILKLSRGSFFRATGPGIILALSRNTSLDSTADSVHGSRSGCAIGTGPDTPRKPPVPMSSKHPWPGPQLDRRLNLLIRVQYLRRLPSAPPVRSWTWLTAR